MAWGRGWPTLWQRAAKAHLMFILITHLSIKHCSVFTPAPDHFVSLVELRKRSPLFNNWWFCCLDFLLPLYSASRLATLLSVAELSVHHLCFFWSFGFFCSPVSFSVRRDAFLLSRVFSDQETISTRFVFAHFYERLLLLIAYFLIEFFCPLWCTFLFLLAKSQ